MGRPVTKAGTWTADQCAASWGIAPATWRSYVATGRAPAPLPGYDADRRRRWAATGVRDYPRPGQGQRNDLTGDRIGQMVAAARVIAGSRGRYDEYSKIYARILDGNPAAVRELLAAARRWAKRKPVPAGVIGALGKVEELAERIGDLGAALLSLPMRERIIIGDARSRSGYDVDGA